MACESQFEIEKQPWLKKPKLESAEEEEKYEEVPTEEDEGDKASIMEDEDEEVPTEEDEGDKASIVEDEDEEVPTEEDEGDKASTVEDEDDKVPIEVDLDEYWANDDFYADDEYGFHEMNPKEWRMYNDYVDKSGGFDVPEFPNAIFYGIQPISCSHPIVYAQVRESSVFATKDKDYEFYKLVKVNEEIVSGSIYYITFLAENLKRKVDSGSTSGDLEKVHVGPNGCQLVELQAQVYYPLPDEERKINMQLFYFNVNDSISEEGLKVVKQFAKK